ncbi:MAG: hypothetical protein M1483_05130 [Actinobacteria bacterium]|nr:hypothetical protein [Actinomycetota bacterium]MCL6104998.1 hypothetical protein [Actinomycetota bacterium]
MKSSIMGSRLVETESTGKELTGTDTVLTVMGVAYMPDKYQAIELTVGSKVDVRNHYLGSWTRGFEIADITDNGYTIRRISDKSILPGEFTADDIRPTVHKQGLWWY